MAQKKKTNAKKKTTKKSVYCVRLHRTHVAWIYVKAESPEAAEQLVWDEGEGHDWWEDRWQGGDLEVECEGEDDEEEPDIGADNEPDEPAEEEEASAKEASVKANTAKKMSEKKASAIIDGIVASMVPIPGKDYRMGKFLVTQAQWVAVMGENPSQFKGAENPVENVSWDDCQAFLEKFNALPAAKASGLIFRLPEEGEWETACRAGATGDYCKLADGTEITEETLGEVAWFDENSNDTTHPVGQKNPNAFGLYDMHGNVNEWTASMHAWYRVSRGGGWGDSSSQCESSLQGWSSPSGRYNGLGFRLCADRGTD